MKQRIPLICLLLAVFWGIIGIATACANQPEEKDNQFNIEIINNVDEFFQNITGTFILKDIESGKMFIYNGKRAKERQAPQSTFKILNALIGLEVKAVKDEYEIKRWDGINRPINVHNQDHTLGSGMKYSVVWYYQAMARDIGEERMKFYIEKCFYGNCDISGGIDKFWLSSSLKISPLEQVDFLEKFYRETLPFDKSVMKTVKRMIVQLEGNDYTLYGKTGSTVLKDNHAVGWYAGFVVVKGHPYIFVTNIDTNVGFAGPKAKELTIDILKRYGLIDQY